MTAVSCKVLNLEHPTNLFFELFCHARSACKLSQKKAKKAKEQIISLKGDEGFDRDGCPLQTACCGALSPHECYACWRPFQSSPACSAFPLKTSGELLDSASGNALPLTHPYVGFWFQVQAQTSGELQSPLGNALPLTHPYVGMWLMK